jgi:hypothetical protein
LSRTIRLHLTITIKEDVMIGITRKSGVLAVCALALLIPQLSEAEHVPGEILVRFEPGAVREIAGGPAAMLGRTAFRARGLEDSLDAVGITDLERLGTHDRAAGPRGSLDMSSIYLVKVSPAADIPRLVERMKRFPGVADAQPNRRFSLYWTPNDSLYSSQWHLENTGQGDALPDVDMDLSAAWDTVTGGNIATYVIDTGLYNHYDISASGADCRNGNCDPGGDYNDTGGHGTAVAGIIGAKCNNGNLGISGVNCPQPSAQVAVGLRCGTAGVNLAACCRAFDYAADNGARIINCSWGGCTEDFALAAATRDAYLRNTYGAFIVCASGNWDGDCKYYPRYPAAYRYTFSVGAINKGGEMYWKSCGGSHQDVCAPGGNYEIVTLSHVNHGYKYDFGGTSAAAPMVSGVAALLLAVDADLYNDDLANIIRRTAIDFEPYGWDVSAGYGIANAHRAVRFISGPDREVVHGTVARGDVSIADSSSLYQKLWENMEWCFGDTTLQDGAKTYLVKRYRLEGEAAFGSPYLDDIRHAWVRHKDGVCPGWPDDNPMDCVLEVGWGEADTTSWDSTSATFYTYTYALYETSDTSFVGYFPIHPDSVEIPYTAVLGPFDDAPYVKLTKPNGGEKWGCGKKSNKPVEWEAYDDDGIDSLTIYWSVGTNDIYVRAWPFVLTSGEGNDSVWTWAVQHEDTCSSNSLVAVVAHDGKLDCTFDMSDDVLTAGGPTLQQFGEGTWLPRRRARPVVHADMGATIYFNIPDPRPVSLTIYDIRGRAVRELVSRRVMEGTHKVRWDLRDSRGCRVARGVYFYRLQAGQDRQTGKVVVVKD